MGRILQQAVEAWQRGGEAIAADELNRFKPLIAALPEAFNFGCELVWLLAI